MLAATGILGLLVRMVTSLALVLGIVAIAYLVMRRRAGSARTRPRRESAARPGARRSAPRRLSPGPKSSIGRRTKRSNRSQIEVLGRVGLTRSTAAVALRFGDRVVLVGASEQAQATVLAEVDLATWELYDTDAEWRVPTAAVQEGGPGLKGFDDIDRIDTLDTLDDVVRAPRSIGFLDALREATVRRG